jgi:hypothetical protein
LLGLVTVCQFQELSIEMMKKIIPLLYDDEVQVFCEFQKVPEEILDEYFEKLYRNAQYEIINNKKISISKSFFDKHIDSILKTSDIYFIDGFINRSPDKVDILDEYRMYFSKKQRMRMFPLSTEEIEEAIENKTIDWKEISLNQNMEEEVLEQYIDKLLVSNMLYYRKLSIGFLSDNLKVLQNKMLKESNYSLDDFWDYMVQYQNLPLDFIQKNIANFGPKSLHSLVCYYALPEEFIEKNAELLDWYFVSLHQKMSVDFILKKVFKYVDFAQLKRNETIDHKKLIKKKIYNIVE